MQFLRLPAGCLDPSITSISLFSLSLYSPTPVHAYEYLGSCTQLNGFSHTHCSLEACHKLENIAFKKSNLDAN